MLHFAAAVLYHSSQRGTDAIKAFYYLAYTHSCWEVLGHRGDFKDNMRCLRDLRDQSLEVSDVARSDITVRLVHALAVQALLE